jgi:hypothetical protein
MDSELESLRKKSQQDLYDFLRTGAALCFTFCDVAETELGLNERQAAQQAIAKAETGYITVRQFLAEVHNEKHRSEIQTTLGKLRTRLDSFYPALTEA